MCHGSSVAGIEPRIEATPHTIDEAARVMARAAEAGAAIVPCGGGSKLALGNPPSRVDLLLRTSALDRTVEYDAENLVITVEAGATIDGVQSRVAGDGLFLPVDPALPWRATIGGVLACNVHGPKRLSYGSLRDLLLGMKVVLTDGEIVRFGGRTIKNVSGYDLSKLFIGSLGTLGVIVEATFRLMPVAAREQVALILVNGAPGGVAHVRSGQRVCASPVGPRGLVSAVRRAGSRQRADGGRGMPTALPASDGVRGSFESRGPPGEAVSDFCSQIPAAERRRSSISDDPSAAAFPAVDMASDRPRARDHGGRRIRGLGACHGPDIRDLVDRSQAENEGGSKSVCGGLQDQLRHRHGGALAQGEAERSRTVAEARSAPLPRTTAGALILDRGLAGHRKEDSTAWGERPGRSTGDPVHQGQVRPRLPC